MTTPTRTPETEPSIGELVTDLTDHSSQLIRDEIEHAKAELREDLKHVGIGAGLGGAAGLIAVFALGTLVTAAVAGLATAMDVWAAALIVTGALLLLAGAAVLVAKNQVSAAGPPIRTAESVKDDLAALKGDLR